MNRAAIHAASACTATNRQSNSNAIAMIANDGVGYMPHLVKSVQSLKTGEVREIAREPTVTLKVKPEQLAFIKHALVGVNKEGTSAAAFKDAGRESGEDADRYSESDQKDGPVHQRVGAVNDARFAFDQLADGLNLEGRELSAKPGEGCLYRSRSVRYLDFDDGGAGTCPLGEGGHRLVDPQVSSGRTRERGHSSILPEAAERRLKGTGQEGTHQHCQVACPAGRHPVV